MNDFKVTKSGKYYNIQYIGYKAPNHTIDIQFYDFVYQSTREQSEHFIQYFREVKTKIEQVLERHKLEHDAGKICRIRLGFIESLASGLDVRSSWSTDEVAERLVEGYNRDYTEKRIICLYILDKAKSARKKPEYISNYVEFDKYSRYNQLYELSLPKVSEFTVTIDDRLDQALKATSELLEKLREND